MVFFGQGEGLAFWWTGCYMCNQNAYWAKNYGTGYLNQGRTL